MTRQLKEEKELRRCLFAPANISRRSEVGDDLDKYIAALIRAVREEERKKRERHQEAVAERYMNRKVAAAIRRKCWR